MSSTDFTAIDFETATGSRSSICQIGLVRVENNVVVKTFNQLICPPSNFYSYWNVKVHGITPERTINAPKFEDVWGQIKVYFENQTVVAHNGAFDFSCLKQVLQFYDLAEVKFEKQCTYKIFKKGLAVLCSEHSIALNHHDALSDAMACARLYQMHMQQKQ